MSFATPCPLCVCTFRGLILRTYLHKSKLEKAAIFVDENDINNVKEKIIENPSAGELYEGKGEYMIAGYMVNAFPPLWNPDEYEMVVSEALIDDIRYVKYASYLIACFLNGEDQ